MTPFETALARIKSIPLRKGRRIIAIAGAPGSGKSTLAQQLGAAIDGACVVPMDGFHRDNDDLQKHGLLHIKGAPQTFDAIGFVALIQGLRNTEMLTFPTFDRDADQTVPNGGQVSATDTTVIVEGNYLLLNTAPWNALADIWDFTILLDVPMPVLRERLVARWKEHGHDEAGALARAGENDLPNARLVATQSQVADLRLGTD